MAKEWGEGSGKVRSYPRIGIVTVSRTRSRLWAISGISLPLAGRGFGKTHTGAETVRAAVDKGKSE